MLKIEEITQLMEADASSEKKLLARKGMKYYEGEHDILHSRLYYYDSDGQLQEDTFRSNIKISHPFFTELVDQQAQYMLSGDESIICSDIPELQTRLDSYFGDGFKSELLELLTGTVAKGFEYMNAYTDADGHTAFKCTDSIGVIEVRAKDTNDGCEYIIFWYIDRIDKGHKTIKRIQVWDKSQIWFYVQVQDGKIELDDSAELNPRPHTIYIDQNGNKYGKGLGYIPFWRLDNNRKQFSGLKTIKSLIDDYDLMACSLSNNLQDFTDALYVVTGFQGNNLDEMIQNIKIKKHIGVGDGGDVDIKTIDIPYQARQVKLDLDEKNIYRFGMGFNSAQLGDGNITNVVIKSRYALLDLKCNKLEIRLKQFLRKLIAVVLDEINQEDGTDYQQKDVYFNFVREVMTNAQDNAQIELINAQRQQVQITTLQNLMGTLDDETIIQNICEVLDIDYEEIKDKLPESDAGDGMDDAQTALNGVMPNEQQTEGSSSVTS